jgi:hypothetical protein
MQVTSEEGLGFDSGDPGSLFLSYLRRSNVYFVEYQYITLRKRSVLLRLYGEVERRMKLSAIHKGL